MNKLLIAFAAAALAVAIAPAAQAGFNLRLGGAASLVPNSLMHKASCDEDCEEYLEEREDARESAGYDDEDYAPARRGVRRQPRVVPAARKTSADSAAVERPASSSKSESAKEGTADPKTSDSKTPDSKNAVAAVPAGGCKQYFASVGMTLSVPCE